MGTSRRVASLLCFLCFADAFGSPVGSAERRSERHSPPRAVTLDAPRNLTVLDYTPRVIIGWTYDGSLTTGFEIERAVLSGPTNVRPDQFSRVGAPGRDARTFRDTTSHGRMTYLYRIRAVGTGTMSPWSTDLIVRVHPAR